METGFPATAQRCLETQPGCSGMLTPMQEAQPMGDEIGGGENEPLHPFRGLFWDTVFCLALLKIFHVMKQPALSFPKAVASSVILLFICFPSFPVLLPSSFSSLPPPSHGSRIIHPIKYRHMTSASCSLFWGAQSKKDPN